MRTQLKLLLEEMDNSDDEAPVKKKEDCEGDVCGDYQAQLEMLAIQNAVRFS